MLMSAVMRGMAACGHGRSRGARAAWPDPGSVPALARSGASPQAHGRNRMHRVLATLASQATTTLDPAPARIPGS